MNWSNEWPKTVGQLIAETVEPEDTVKGPTFDGNIWTRPATLSIIIKDGDFPTTVEAIQVGDLAVHRDLRKGSDTLWQVTHVPTLTRFNAIQNRLYKQTDIIEWCKKVQSQLQDDWKELAKLTHECYKDRSEAKDRIMYLCQGTEV